MRTSLWPESSKKGCCGTARPSSPLMPSCGGRCFSESSPLLSSPVLSSHLPHCCQEDLDDLLRQMKKAPQLFSLAPSSSLPACLPPPPPLPLLRCASRASGFSLQVGNSFVPRAPNSPARLVDGSGGSLHEMLSDLLELLESKGVRQVPEDQCWNVPKM